jgi:PIN domain nuclease of toxin-antitoxin system
VNLLLDTQALLWMLVDDERLGESARRIMADPLNDVLVSAVSAWKIAIKLRLGRLETPADVGAWLPQQLASDRATRDHGRPCRSVASICCPIMSIPSTAC